MSPVLKIDRYRKKCYEERENADKEVATVRKQLDVDMKSKRTCEGGMDKELTSSEVRDQDMRFISKDPHHAKGH